MSEAAFYQRAVQPTARELLPDELIALLRSHDARLVSETPDELTVSDAKRLWSTRLTNARKITHAPLEGVDALLAKLTTLPQDAIIFELSYVADGFAAAVFFEQYPGAFLGYALMDKAKAGKAA
jgi:hypothetical protein